MQYHKPSWTYGLERPADLRDDYTSSLEVVKTELEKGPQVNIYPVPPPIPPKTINPHYHHHELSSPKQPLPASRTTCGLQRSRLWLFAILTTFILASIVAASIAGVLISQKKHTASHQLSQPPAAAPATNNPTTIPSTASLPAASAAALIIPTSDCPSLHPNTTYTLPANPASSLPRAVNFAIQCNSDYKLPLIMAMRTYRFEDCMQACATHAANAPDASSACVVAVYKPGSGQSITCWLKSQDGAEDAPIENLGVDSARIVVVSDG
ncbi:MAG: hypothetical protein Q9202_006422 [Teloschistes flavicans]